ERAGDTDTVVWKVDEGSVRDDAVRSRIEPALREISGMEGVGDVTGPYEEQGRTQIARDGRIAYAQVTFTEQADALPKDLVQDVVDTARGARSEERRVGKGCRAGCGRCEQR